MEDINDYVNDVFETLLDYSKEDQERFMAILECMLEEIEENEED